MRPRSVIAVVGGGESAAASDSRTGLNRRSRRGLTSPSLRFAAGAVRAATPGAGAAVSAVAAVGAAAGAALVDCEGLGAGALSVCELQAANTNSVRSEDFVIGAESLANLRPGSPRAARDCSARGTQVWCRHRPG